jgi:hypothetical protein
VTLIFVAVAILVAFVDIVRVSLFNQYCCCRYLKENSKNQRKEKE